MEASSRLAVGQAFEAADSIDSIRIEDKGFSVLADPSSACLDVIFVHGLTGHARRTWTFTGPKTPSDARKTLHTDDSSERPSKIQRLLRPGSSDSTTTSNDVFWPLDLLTQTLPNARLLAYGYDSNIRHRLQVPVNQSTILDLGQDLLTDLEALRRSQPTRPLIFVAHSLGGIIAKETLRRSEGHRVYQKEFYSIYDATVALMFFGTPHRGADPQSLLRSISETVIRLAGYTINDRLVNSLLPSSERLKELREEFSKMSRTKDWRIYSFQEQYGMQTLNGKKVVEDESSNLDDPTIEITQRIAGDHVQMCRFKGFDDVEYRKVAAAFDRLARFGIEDINKPVFTAEQGKACLESLAFKQIDDRLMNIRRAHHATCTWLFEQPEYRNWLDIDKIHDHHGFLWIKGKPGAGKSTIMKHVFLQCKENPGSTQIISYFFNARGGIMEKSTLGMYRSLVCQLLMAIPQLQVDLIPRFLEKERHSEIIEWSIGELQTFLSGAINRIRERQFIFIDALDECEENEVRDMIEFLEQLANDALSRGVYLNICLSSRHYPHIRIKKGIQLVIEGQRGHDGDIAKYVNSKLEAEGQGPEIDDIKAEILRKASGVFLWVVLVVQMLNKAFDHGQVHAVQTQLLAIPDKLDDLFTDIWIRDAENKDDSILLLQWLLFARRSLTPKELYVAVRSGNDPTALQSWDHIQTSDENVAKFILSCSKGHAEISKSKDPTVQFIHESVRDYFLRKNGLARLQSELSSPTLESSQHRLTQCCYQYIMMDTSQHLPADTKLPKARSKEAKDLMYIASREFPFLEYAVQNIFGHADAAEEYGISQKAFLKEFCPPNGSKLKKWITYNNIFQQYENRRYSHRATLLYILSEQNHSNIVKVLLDDVVDIDAAGERYGSALQAASVNGHERIVRLLVDAGANTNLESREYVNSLFAAIRKGHNDIATLLVEGGAEINVKDRNGVTALYKASRHGQQALVQQLLEIGADVNARGGEYGTALLAASHNGQVAVVRLLLEKGADVNAQEGYYGNALQAASYNGQVAVVRLLLDKGADVNAQGGYYGNALQVASAKGHEAMVRLLLDKGADVNAPGGYYGNALQAASHNRQVAVVRLLLEKGANVNAQGGFLGNALQAAAIRGREDIVRLLLDKGADVHAKEGYHGNALQVASAKGHEAIVRLLLEKGANVNAQGGFLGNALQAAAIWGREDIVRLLLDKGADVNAQGGYYGNALQAASAKGHEAMVRLLLDKGADVNAPGGRYSNALQAASKNGHGAVAMLLLEKGAKVM
ncbi:MAG: hypothetical protein M1824_000949 [Vezdaea acicularis]|nr:MAG: hypothetical protein M1824_000949 [Vezdaea acicularis]